MKSVKVILDKVILIIKINHQNNVRLIDTERGELYMSNYFSYMRISTKLKRKKQTFARQEKALEAYASKMGIEYLVTFRDEVSGATFDREDWLKLDKLVRKGDTIVFKEISRFTREAENGYDKYMDLMNRGVNLVFLDNPTVSTDYIKALTVASSRHDLVTKTALEGTIKLLLIVELDRVQKEREIFVQRVKQGIQASNKKSGRVPGKLEKMSEELKADIRLFLTDRSIKQIDLMKKYNISRNTLKKYIKEVQSNR